MAEISSAIVCDFAQVRDNLLFVVAGGITRVYRPNLPAQLGLCLALIVEVPSDERGQVHEIVAACKHSQTAEELFRIVGAAQAHDLGDLEPGESQFLPLAVDLRSVGAARYGSYDVHTSVDGQPGPLLTFYVKDKPTSG